MPTLATSFDEYLKSKPLQPSVKRGYTRDIYRLTEWQHREIGSLTLEELRHKYEELSRTYSPNLAFKSFRALRMVAYVAGVNQGAVKTVLRHRHKRGKTLRSEGLRLCSDKPALRPYETTPIADLPHWYRVVSTARSATVKHFLLTLLFTGLPWRIVRELQWESIDFEKRAFNIDGQLICLPDVVFSMLLTRRKTSTYVFERSKGQRMGVRCKSAITQVRIAFSEIAATHNVARRNIGIAPGGTLTKAESELIANELVKISKY